MKEQLPASRVLYTAEMWQKTEAELRDWSRHNTAGHGNPRPIERWWAAAVVFFLSPLRRSREVQLNDVGMEGEIGMTGSTGWAGTIRGMPAAGQIAERFKTVGMRDIELFTEITGDRNPLHYDELSARQSVFGGLIVQGGVTSGMLNAIVAEELPGPGTVFLAMELKFVKAVYVGDTITGRVEVTSVRADKPICTIAVSVRNQGGELCLSGVATTYTAPLSAAST
jgi:acyl dehydratase